MNFYKLSMLPRATRLRKVAKMFDEAERLFCASGAWGYPLDDLVAALAVVEQDFPAGTAINEAAALLKNQNAGESEKRRAVNAVRHLLLAETGQSQADWDFLDTRHALDSQKRRVFEGMGVYLEDIRSPFNVGSLFRSAESFGVEKITLSPFSADPLHKRAERSAMGCIAAVQWERAPFVCTGPLFALETGGTPLPDFRFPRCATLIVGSEELGVSPTALAAADASLGRVSIPTYGAKGSLNVSAAFAIVVQAWAAALNL
jgi:TrmH family RNA methyltransferase